MNLNISPGPWTWEPEILGGYNISVVYGADGDAVAQVRGNLGYDILPEDNARLIAEAPAMLEALIFYIQHGSCRFDKIINLLEKATGKTWEELNDSKSD
jgi:hypothetical protein